LGIARTADTKVTGDLKVGEKVTVEYSMTATTIEVKAAKADAPRPRRRKRTRRSRSRKYCVQCSGMP